MATGIRIRTTVGEVDDPVILKVDGVEGEAWAQKILDFKSPGHTGTLAQGMAELLQGYLSRLDRQMVEAEEAENGPGEGDEIPSVTDTMALLKAHWVAEIGSNMPEGYRHITRQYVKENHKELRIAARQSVTVEIV